MKKLIAMLLALIMVLSLAACGASEPAPTPTNPPAAVTDKTDDTAKEPEVKTVSSTGHSLVPSSNTLKALWNTSSYDLNTTIEVGVIEEQTGFDIQWDALPAENTQEVLMMTIGSGSDYDMFFTNKVNTFRQLLDKGYVPFTVKELIGEDPVEPGDAWVGNQMKRLENGADMDVSAVLSNKLCTNYAICTVEFQVKNADGEVLYSYNPHVNTLPYTYEVPMSGSWVTDEAKALANGSNTVHIYVRLATGELKEAFNTVLK